MIDALWLVGWNTGFRGPSSPLCPAGTSLSGSTVDGKAYAHRAAIQLLLQNDCSLPNIAKTWQLKSCGRTLARKEKCILPLYEITIQTAHDQPVTKTNRRKHLSLNLSQEKSIPNSGL